MILFFKVKIVQIQDGLKRYRHKEELEYRNPDIIRTRICRENPLNERRAYL